MQLLIIGSIDEIGAAEWNALSDGHNPFVRHEFLSALERHHCVGEHYGWIPQHVIARDQSNTLIAAVPMYLKDNSYGEFVFDWNWADAYHRNGLTYYPKLVVAVPYTPVSGPRILTKRDDPQLALQLIQATREHAERLKVSSLHWLFTDNQTTQRLQQTGFMRRLGCQFHWNNRDYANFDDYLATMSADKRKKIKRERRHVQEADIQFEVLDGHAVSSEQWRIYHRFYESTFAKLGGHATLTLPFFEEIGRTMADNIVLVMAKRHNRYIASAFSLRGSHSLYGRHWGCEVDYNSLHFEACYYQGIEYCIKHRLSSFEPGAQGEHKISRGFLPSETYSTHWIAEPDFKTAISRFLEHEIAGMQHYMSELLQHSPYKHGVET
jgi:predicted N-acyltransferase